MTPSELAVRDFGLLLMVASAMGSVGANESDYRLKFLDLCNAYLALEPEPVTLLQLSMAKLNIMALEAQAQSE